MTEKLNATMGRVTPILRIFDEKKAKEFYLDFLGFKLDFEHRFEEDLPLYMQVSSGNCLLHLSEHHNDCSPGAAVRIEVDSIQSFHSFISSKKSKYIRPGIERSPWNTLEVTATDPFHNRLVFFEVI